MKDRIKLLRNTSGISQEELAKTIKVTNTAVSAWEKGIRNPSEQSIRLICDAYNINEDWLKFGTGDMFNEQDIQSLIAQLLSTNNSVAFELFSALAKLDEKDWKVIEKIIDSLKGK